MIHTPADEVLLTLVALRRLVVVPGLLLLLLWSLPLSTVIELAWSVLAISLGATVSIVSHFATSKASIATGGSRGIVPHRCTCSECPGDSAESWDAALTDRHAELATAVDPAG
jgi:hypothetical protein